MIEVIERSLWQRVRDRLRLFAEGHMSEHALQDRIRLELSKRGIVLRLNVMRVQAPDGRWLTSGLPVGTSDLLFIGGGRAAFIEVKTPRGRVSQAQADFIAAVNREGAPHVTAGVARSVEDAVRIAGGMLWGVK